MTPIHALLLLRFIELAFMVGCFSWLVWGFPPSRLRNVRLTLATILILINLVAVVIAVGWAKVTLW